jgi:uncharacterized membrane protein YciS (DUF1049 family)
MLDQSYLLHNASERKKFFLQYIAITASVNLVWEVLQLPLYTLWNEGTPSAIGFAVVHCTMGDVLIAALSLTAALILVGYKQWPRERFLPVALLAVTIGVSYTVFSEWNNTVVTRAWAYSSLMPTIFGVGLSPLAQWFIVPGFAFWYLKAHLKSGGANL